MTRSRYSDILFQGWFTIILFGVLGLVLAIIISFVQPLKYSSTVRLLILQDVGVNVDAYTASRSEERIAENLSTIIFTTTFFDEVVKSGFNIRQSSFSDQDYKRRREWGKTVAATVTRGSGLLTIRVYHRDVVQAEQIARAVSFVLTQRVQDFTSGDNVEVRLIDDPLNSRWPVKPNVPINAFSGLILGCFFGVAYVLMQSERIKRRHQFVHG
ncbi:YveK family protein [Patescibacteria group bacterium]